MIDIKLNYKCSIGVLENILRRVNKWALTSHLKIKLPFFALLDTRVLNSFEELCIMRVEQCIVIIISLGGFVAD